MCLLHMLKITHLYIDFLNFLHHGNLKRMENWLAYGKLARSINLMNPLKRWLSENVGDFFALKSDFVLFIDCIHFSVDFVLEM